MHLGKLYSRFDSRCKSLDKRANLILASKSSLSQWELTYLTTTLISTTWQHWSTFCRKLIIHSCQGARARDLTKITPRLTNNTIERIAYEASLAKQSGSISNARNNGHINFSMWQEPTWGDPSKITKIITGLNPSNSITLLSILGSPNYLHHLQLVRNACSHKNSETLSRTRRLSLDYNFNKLQHPSEIAWATHKVSNDIAYFYWLYEMNLIADYATSTN